MDAYGPREAIPLKEIESAMSGVFTVDDVLKEVGFGRMQLMLGILTGMLWAIDAVEVSLLGIIAPEARCSFGLTPAQEAFISTVFFIGAIPAGYVWGRMGDRYGRKTSLILCAVTTVYFSILSGFAMTYWWLLILRALTGFTEAGLDLLSISWFFEFTTTKIRGRFMAWIQLISSMTMMGIVALAMGIIHLLNWHYVLVISGALCSLVFPLFLVAPESPYYYMSRGRRDKAREVLQQLVDKQNKSLPPGELVSLQTKRRLHARQLGLEVKEAEKVQSGWHALCSPPKVLLTTILLWFVWFVETFVYYGVILLTSELLILYHDMPDKDTSCVESIRNKEKDVCHHLTTGDYLKMLWTTSGELPGVVICFVVNDLLSRRRSLSVQGFLLMVSVSLTLICPLSKIGTFGLLFLARSLAGSIFLSLYLYTPEVYPTNARSFGVGMGFLIARFGGIITPFFSQVVFRTFRDALRGGHIHRASKLLGPPVKAWVLLHHTVHGTKAIYALCGFLIGVVGFLLPFETKHRSLEGVAMDADTHRS